MTGKDNKKLWGVGLGAGLLGAFAIALRYALRPRETQPLPDSISPAIFATKVLQTSVGEMVYHESGSGQPLVFVHGVAVGASSYEWSKVYPKLAHRFRVLALDLIGFGESARPNATLTEADYVRSIAEFCRTTCGERKPILVGSGLGGGFCAHLASQHPELVSRLILLMPTGLSDFGRPRLPFTMRLLSRMPLLNRFVYRNYLSTRAAVLAWLTQFGFADAGKVSDETVDVFTTFAQQYGAQHAITNLMAGRLNFDLENRMRGLMQPVTLIWSDCSPYPPLEWAYALQRVARSCQLVILEGVGPLAALEEPKTVAGVLKDQLDDELRVFKTG